MKCGVLSFAFVLCCAGLAAQSNSVPSEAGGAKEGEARLFGKTVTISKDGGDLSEEVGTYSRKKGIRGPLKPHGPQEVFLRMNDQVLTWGCVDAYIDQVLEISPLSFPPQATSQDVEKILANGRIRAATSAANAFIRDWILVPQARDCGIGVSEAEIGVALTNSVKKVQRKHKSAVLAAIQDKESFFYRNQVGYLITKKYIDGVLSKEVTVSPDEIATAIRARNDQIGKAKEYNGTLRPRMEGWLREIRDGARDFGETAYEFSDCGSSADDGEWGEFEAEDNNLLQPLRDFIFADSTNVLSGVIETPYSYHIVKILKKEYDGGVSKGVPDRVKVAQIMLEKEDVPEILTEEGARRAVFRRKLGELAVAREKAAWARVKASEGFACEVPVSLFKPRKKGKEESK